MSVIENSRRLTESGIFLFFRHGRHFHDPQVACERERLLESDVLDDPGVVAVVDRLVEEADRIERGIYAPVPIARGLESGESWSDLLTRFRYSMIEVDEEQRWWWQGRPVAARIQDFFSQNIGWQPDLGRHFVEYRINDDWFDKCYFDGAMTPLLATAIDPDGPRLVLKSGQRPTLDLTGVRLDDQERMFLRTRELGEALASEGLRFKILSSVSDDLETVEIAGERVPLIGPEIG